MGRTTIHGDELRCLNCGQSYQMNLPAPMSMVVAMARAFADEHEICAPTEKGAAKMRYATPDEWRNSWDTGASSLTIYGVMMGRPVVKPAIPLDPDDFGRCYRMLKAFPEWRMRIGEVAEKHPEWAELVANWERLEFLFEQESPSGRAPQLLACLQRCR